MEKEEVVEIRVKQLSLAKVMVNIHKKSSFLLVTAHSQLGEAYINTQCFEQALEHLTIALKYNGEILNQVSETKDYHIHLLTMLGRCYLEAGSPKESLNLLQKGYELSQHV
jgi:tetratricopeptide (TPR) repeat protein